MPAYRSKSNNKPMNKAKLQFIREEQFYLDNNNSEEGNIFAELLNSNSLQATLQKNKKKQQQQQ